MKSKKLNIIEIVLHILAVVLLFVRGMFYCYLSGESYRRVHNAFTDLPSGSVLPITFVMLVVFSLFLCVLWAFGKKKKVNVLHILLPIVAMLLFFFIGFLYSVGEYATLVEQLTVAISSGSSSYGLGPIYLMEVAVLVAITVVAVIKKKCHSEPEENVPVQNAIEKETGGESLDLLIKYKKLLDEGVITQEGFDKKKEELL